MPLPPPACPHPGMGEAKAYAKFRRRRQAQYVAEKVQEMAKPRVEKILALPTWDEKQDAVDELFETVEAELKEEEEILGKHPQFGKWVELGLHRYLRSVSAAESEKVPESKESGDNAETTEDDISETDSNNPDDESAHPIFMDCFSPNEPDEIVPSILSPLKAHKSDGTGRMVEEWELSAHKKTKRILMRQATREIARILEEHDSSRIFVHGRKGVGKVCEIVFS